MKSFTETFEEKFKAAQNQVARRSSGHEHRRETRRDGGNARVEGEESGGSPPSDDNDCGVLSWDAIRGVQAATGDDAEIKRLAGLPRVEYERERVEASRRLGIRAVALDREIANLHKSDDAKQGRALSLPEPEPWPEAVNGAELLDQTSEAVRRHVVMPAHAADTAALWTAHTYLVDCFGISPRLAITSPEKGCGKTTLLDALSRIVFRPLPAANATAPAIFRVVGAYRPTLLIDEADTFLSENEELRGILNSGHRQGGAVIRTVGEDFEPRSFSTYSACAIALIGKLPSTLADRSVSIELRRRLPDELIELFRLDRTAHLDRLARMLARWAFDCAERIRDIDPNMPDGVFNRAADNWRPLLAIADAAGGHWPERARLAVQQTGTAGQEESVRVLLLSDVRAIFADRRLDRLSSAELLASLIAIEGRPWAEWKVGKPLTASGLARLLAAFKITPNSVRISDHTPKGYHLTQFHDAFARYLPAGGL